MAQAQITPEYKVSQLFIENEINDSNNKIKLLNIENNSKNIFQKLIMLIPII